MYYLKKLFIQFSQFFTGNVLSLLFGFLTFPIFTRILTKEQYGIMSLITTTMLLSVAIAKAGLSDGIIRFYKENSKTNEDLTIFSSTVLIRGLFLSGLTVILYLILFQTLNMEKLLKIDNKYVICFIIMSAYLFIRPLNIIVYNFLRVNDMTKLIIWIILSEKIISVGLSLLFLLYIVKEFYGYFLGIVLAEYLVSLFLFYWFFKNFSINIKKVSGNLTVKMIKFGIPLLLNELCFLLLSYVDRYLIMVWHGEALLGLYSVGYNLAMYLGNIILFSLSYSIVPIYVEIYERQGKEKTILFLEKSMKYLLIIIIAICFGYSAVTKDLFITFASEKYMDAAKFSPIILIGTLFLAINSIFNAGLYLKKKTMKIFIISAIAVIINVIFNILLLPKYGAMGAAIATLIACLTSSTLTIILSFRYIKIKIDLKNIIYYLGLSGIMIIVVKQIEFNITWLNLLIKSIIGIMIIIGGILYKEKIIFNEIKKRYQIRNYYKK